MTNNYAIHNNNVFSMFPSYELEQSAVINKVDMTDKPDEMIISPENKKDKSTSGKKTKIILGSTLATTIAAAGVIGLFFAKGLHGSSLNKLSKFKETLAKELQETAASPKDIPVKTVYYCKKGVKKTIDVMQASSNFTAIKDSITDKILKMNKFTAKFAKSTKSLFQRIVDKTLGKKYDKVGVKVKDLTSLLKHYDIEKLNQLTPEQKLAKIKIKGEEHTVAEWIEKLSQETGRLEQAFDGSFSLGARRMRGVKRSNMLSGLSDKISERFFKNKQALLNINNYKTYATEELSQEAQNELKAEILGARKQVTNNISSICDSIKGQINGFSQIVKPDDELMKTSSQELRKKLEAFRKCSGTKEAQTRVKISKQITSMVDDLVKVIKSNEKYSAAEQESMISYLTSMKDTVLASGNESKGSLEEIMTILNGLRKSKIVPENSYKEFSKLSSKISKELEKATELEMGEYFLKQAELEVGSGATDAISVLFPVGVGAFAVARGDNKDEKISATLTTCIPLVGTFATFVYGTSKMFSGAKNLAFSLVTGALISAFGNYCDKLYKKYKNSGSVVKVVQDECNNIVTDITPNMFQPATDDKK